MKHLWIDEAFIGSVVSLASTSLASTMMILLYLAAFWYVLIATLLFKTWLAYMDIDQEMTFNQQILSWLMLFVTSTLWVLFLPLTYLELLKKQSSIEAKTAEAMKLKLRN